MSIKNWPRAERPRERLINYGASALSDTELLAILINQGQRGRTALDTARELLAHFGCLRNLFTAPLIAFADCPGVGTAKYSLLQATHELAKRMQQEAIKDKNVLNNSLATKQFLAAKLRHSQIEIFACLYLDCKNRIINYEELAHGTIDHAAVHARELVKAVLKHNAANIILAHNHPSGSAEVSQADRDITNNLQQALATIDVRVIDHIVIGDTTITSFVEMGWL